LVGEVSPGSSGSQAQRFKSWADVYRLYADSGTGLAWPSETLVRMLKGEYVPGLPDDYRGKKVLDVGFGTGNNLAFLGSLGMRLCGTEIDQSICDTTADTLSGLGFECDLRVGSNTQIPFEDESFDYLVSWNVIHYEDNEGSVIAGLREYARVMKPGGRVLLSTTGPRHQILNGASTIGSHIYRIGRPDDFRRGELFFFFDSPNYVQHYFSRSFDDVRIGRVTDDLFGRVLDWWVVSAVKGA